MKFKLNNLDNVHLIAYRLTIFFVLLISGYLGQGYYTNIFANQEAGEINREVDNQEVSDQKSVSHLITSGEIRRELHPDRIAEAQAKADTQGIQAFLNSKAYNRIDESYLALLYKDAGDIELLKLVIAISVAESSLGSEGLAAYKQSNFWNVFPGGDRYWNPTREVMSIRITTLVRAKYWAANVDFQQAKAYVKGPNADCSSEKCIGEVKNWQHNINNSINQM